jgi:hypothetical protein
MWPKTEYHCTPPSPASGRGIKGEGNQQNSTSLGMIRARHLFLSLVFAREGGKTHDGLPFTLADNELFFRTVGMIYDKKEKGKFMYYLNDIAFCVFYCDFIYLR